jgi:hypothetical protein
VKMKVEILVLDLILDMCSLDLVFMVVEAGKKLLFKKNIYIYISYDVH